jgi:drug/metabolite transporter (DMT)-like permease
MGILFGAYTIYLKLFVESELFIIRAALAVLIFFLGCMFLLFAMLFDMEQERNMGWT